MDNITEQQAKLQLENSKEKLACSLEKIEKLIEQKILDNKSINIMQEKIDFLTKENKELNDELAEIKSQYANMQLTTMQVAEELNTSISAIEEMVESWQ